MLPFQLVLRGLWIRQLAVLVGAICALAGCEVASGLKPRVFATQFREASCGLMTRCGMYPSEEACLPTQGLFADQQTIPNCPCYNANAARDCIEALKDKEGTCDPETPFIDYPAVCKDVCCPDSCDDAACTLFRQPPNARCDSVLGDFGDAQAMRQRLQEEGAVAFCQAIPETATLHFDSSVERKLPEPALAAKVLYYGAGPLSGSVDTVAPCGQTVDELVLCASASAGVGDHYVVLYQTAAPLPLADPENLYEIGVVFDGDEQILNNYVPDARFADDFFENTDQWFVANYNPTTGWVVRVFLARDKTVVAETQSEARIIISGRTVALLVPKTEVMSFDPAVRITLFRHAGDLGRGDDNNWSGLVFPAQRQALLRRVIGRPF